MCGVMKECRWKRWKSLQRANGRSFLPRHTSSGGRGVWRRRFIGRTVRPRARSRSSGWTATRRSTAAASRALRSSRPRRSINGVRICTPRAGDCPSSSARRAFSCSKYSLCWSAEWSRRRSIPPYSLTPHAISLRNTPESRRSRRSSLTRSHVIFIARLSRT